VYAFGAPGQSKLISTPVIVGIVVFCVAAAIIVLFYVIKKKQYQTQTNFLKRLKIPISIVLVLVLAVSVLFVLTALPSKLPNLLWKTNIAHFANDIAFVDGKVAITTPQGVYGYDADNGSLLWTSTLSTGGKMQVYERKLYVAGFGSTVYGVNQTTGQTILPFHAPVWSSAYMKSFPASFHVADGKVFVTGDGTAVFNATTGEEFWETTNMLPKDHTFPLKPIIILGPASSSAPESNYIYMKGASRVNPNNGEVLWDASHYQVLPPVIVDNQVIFWGTTPDLSTYLEDKPVYGHGLVSINATSGEVLWNYEVDAKFFEPTPYNDLLLCGANDGYFYALNLSNGTLAWKTKVDTQNLMKGENLPAQAKSNSEPGVSQVIVDSKDNTATWAFLITQFQINGENGNNLYVGRLTTLDISDGRIPKTTIIQRNGTVSSSSPPTPTLGLASFKNTFYMTAGVDLWTINRATGYVTTVQSFEHSILPPILGNNMMYVAADLYLYAFN
jgi:outer membrane protein assembly factor BamB